MTIDRRSILSPTSSRFWDLMLVGLCACAILLLFVWPFVDVSLGGDQYLYLARHLIGGRLDVDNMPAPYGDYAPWHGHKYLPFGPLPAVLLIPFLPLINLGMPMVVAGYAMTAINVFVFFRVLGLIGIADERRLWATILYFAGTPYLSLTLVGISTYFAQIVATTFLLVAIYVLLRQKRLPLAGLSLGLAAAARATTVFALPFFVWLIVAKRHDEAPDNSTGSVSRAAQLIIGLSIPLALLLAYNYTRFGNPAESGFGIAVLYNKMLVDARSVGLFSIAHVPKNLFMMLLQGALPVGGDNSPVLRFPFIEPSRWGMGLFFTSPALVYIFRARLSERIVQACWIATLVILVPIITYYGIGYVQFGYRYALDFMPFLVLLVARGFPHPMTNPARTLVTLSVLVNIWGAITLAVWL